MLLHDWAWGKLYGTDVQRYCHAAYRDGLTKVQEVTDIASMGAWGTRPGNVHQALTKKYIKNNTLPAPEVASVKCRAPRTLDLLDASCHVLCPHDMFAAMFKEHPEKFHELFGTESLSKFWKGASRHSRDTNRMYNNIQIKPAGSLKYRCTGPDLNHATRMFS